MSSTQKSIKFIKKKSVVDKMDIQTKVGIELLAKSYYDEWIEQKKALEEKKKLNDVE